MKTSILTLALALPFIASAADFSGIPTAENSPKIAGRETSATSTTLTAEFKSLTCNKTEKIIDAVVNDFGEKAIWSGVGEGPTAGSTVFLLVGEAKHTWTLIEVKGPTTCILGTGENFFTQVTFPKVAGTVDVPKVTLDPTLPKVQTMFSDDRLTLCNKLDKVVDVVSKDFGEKPIWSGMREGNSAEASVGLTVNADKNTWTLIETKGATTCLISSGQKFTLDKNASNTY
jgi:hypothetical protein